jgi:hypothetical protein
MENYKGRNETHSANIFNKKLKIDIKRWAKVDKKITKNIEMIFAM